MDGRARIITFWALVAAVLGLGAVMAGWSVPRLTADAGAPIFDMRGAGFGIDEARAFLRALSPEGVQFYLNVQQRLDLLFPALFGLVMAWSILWASRPLPIWIGGPFAVLAILGALADYAENIAVAGMLRAGADAVTLDQVSTASRWVITKTLVWGVVGLVLLQLIIWRGWRGWRARIEKGKA